jgi:GMP synthase-like glutamine amidotransferase
MNAEAIRSSLTIGILETGRPTMKDLMQEHGTYVDMTEKLLCSSDQFFKDHVLFKRFAVFEGIFPGSPRSCDAWVVTGSPHGVYEQLPWMIELQNLLRVCINSGVPVIGICFGHQILAAAMGGSVIKAPQGWGLGVQTYKWADVGVLEGAGLPLSEVKLLAMHQDQVVSLPPTAKVVLKNDHCPFACLQYGHAALSFQFHPEFPLAYERAVIQRWLMDGLVPADVCSAAIQSLNLITDDRLDSSVMGKCISTFILEALKHNDSVN